MPIEILSIDKMLLQALAADPTLQSLLGFLGHGNSGNNPRFPSSATDASAAIFADVSPLGTPEPQIIFDMLDNMDTNAMGGFRAFEHAVYSIRVCASGIGYGGLKPYADAVDNCIQGYGPILDSSNNIWVYKFIRETTIRMNTIINNVTWYYLGGTYCTITSQ